MPNVFKVGDRVLAPNPDSLSKVLPGVITGKDRRRVSVDFGRNNSDIWPYDVTELIKAEL